MLPLNPPPLSQQRGLALGNIQANLWPVCCFLRQNKTIKSNRFDTSPRGGETPPEFFGRFLFIYMLRTQIISRFLPSICAVVVTPVWMRCVLDLGSFQVSIPWIILRPRPYYCWSVCLREGHI